MCSVNLNYSSKKYSIVVIKVVLGLQNFGYDYWGLGDERHHSACAEGSEDPIWRELKFYKDFKTYVKLFFFVIKKQNSFCMFWDSFSPSCVLNFSLSTISIFSSCLLLNALNTINSLNYSIDFIKESTMSITTHLNLLNQIKWLFSISQNKVDIDSKLL